MPFPGAMEVSGMVRLRREDLKRSSPCDRWMILLSLPFKDFGYVFYFFF